MSAWYIWTALGMYPLNPASGEYVFGYPLVQSARVQLPSQKTLRIEVKKIKGTGQTGIASVRFNNKKIPVQSITHNDLMKGGLLTYTVYE
jgi:putative alpha-1,2-mannosidase